MVVHLFLNNNKDLDFLPINSIKNGGVTSELVSDGWLIEKTPILQTTLEKKRVTVKEYFMNTLYRSDVLQAQEIQDFLRRYELQNIKKAS